MTTEQQDKLEKDINDIKEMIKEIKDIHEELTPQKYILYSGLEVARFPYFRAR